MLLKDVLKNVNFIVYGDADIDISGLEHKSQSVKNGDLYFCITGNVDGHNFAADAIEKGAVAIVVERKLESISCPQILVTNSREAMSMCANNFYGNPSKDLIVIGVTGTNGKTTTTYLLKRMLESAGKEVGMIGTNGAFWKGQIYDTNMTTPDPIITQQLLKKMKDDGVEYVCMEMSAHAAQLQKLRGLMTDIILFTNLTQDHLDYFESMEKYGAAKQSLFSKSFADYAVINVDDKFGRKIANDTNLPYLSYSLKNDSSDIKAVNIEHTNSGANYILKFQNQKIEVNQKLFGDFNISNVLGVVGAGVLLGLDLKTIKRGIENLSNVPGRFNVSVVKDVKYVVDYAHTPDGLENVLKAARYICDNRLISVFGCGGNRDVGKRPIMGEISSHMADFTILTSDNPRDEKPGDIINDIITDNMLDNFTVEEDRRKAIILASSIARPGDVVLISGKGAEKYIEQNGKKRYYSDYDVIKEIESKNELKL